MKATPWTEKEDKLLRQCLLFSSLKAVALMLDRSEGDCRERLKVKSKRWSPTEEEKELIAAFLPREAARLFGVHINVIRSHRGRINAAKKPRATPIQKSISVIKNNPVITNQNMSPPVEMSEFQPKPKPTLNFILSRFPLTRGQRRMATDIFKYSPASAYRYARLVSQPATTEGNPKKHVGHPCN